MEENVKNALLLSKAFFEALYKPEHLLGECFWSSQKAYQAILLALKDDGDPGSLEIQGTGCVEWMQMGNRLVVVGFLGGNQCYLNVPREDAVRRYKENIRRSKERDISAGFTVKEEWYGAEEGKDFSVEEFEFEDEFWAYEAKREG